MSQHEQKKAYVPAAFHPRLIGKGGATVKQLQTDHNVRIKIPNKEENSDEIVIVGPNEDVQKAWKSMETLLGFKMSSEPLLKLQLDVAKNQHGSIIGSGGAILRDLESKTGCTVKVPGKTDESNLVELSGPKHGISKAMEELEKLLRGKLKIVGSEKREPHKVKLDLTSKPINEALFFPDDSQAHFERFISYLRSATKTLDICVFTITDDRISDEIEALTREGVKVRIITDNDTANQEGSDIQKFKQVGIPVKMDKTNAHMHHKFAVVDGVVLINGSFNWTRQASLLNCENVMVTNAKEFVYQFAKQFQTMWDDTSKFE